VVYVGNIDATGSGVIGSTVKLEASGSITGLVFARENIDLSAQQSENVTALAQGSVNVSAGGSVSGTIIGVGSVSASGSAVDAALLSQNISASGNVSSSQVGFSQGAAANATSQSVQNDEPAKQIASAKRMKMMTAKGARKHLACPELSARHCDFAGEEMTVEMPCDESSSLVVQALLLYRDFKSARPLAQTASGLEPTTPQT
jgi:hypothetical protein